MLHNIALLVGMLHGSKEYRTVICGGGGGGLSTIDLILLVIHILLNNYEVI